MSDMETIVAAAVHAKGITFSVPAPGRHGDVLRIMHAELGLDAIRLGVPDNQGFLTSAGRFVGRREAAGIAVEAGQINEPKWGSDLYSEDLW